MKDLAPEEWERSAVGAIMTRAPLRTIAPEADVTAALRELVSGAFQQLPVMSDGRPVGIIGRKEVLRSIALRNELDLALRRRWG